MSNLEKIIKIAANSSFNNSHFVTTFKSMIQIIKFHMTDVSSNYLDKRDPVLTQHFTVDDMSGNAASFNELYVNGTSITSSGGGATEEQINQISTNQSNISILLTTTQTHTAEILDISATRLPNIITDVSENSSNILDISSSLATNLADFIINLKSVYIRNNNS